MRRGQGIVNTLLAIRREMQMIISDLPCSSALRARSNSANVGQWRFCTGSEIFVRYLGLVGGVRVAGVIAGLGVLLETAISVFFGANNIGTVSRWLHDDRMVG